MTRIYKPCRRCKKRTCNRHKNQPLCITHLRCHYCTRPARQRGHRRLRVCKAHSMRERRADAA